MPEDGVNQDIRVVQCYAYDMKDSYFQVSSAWLPVSHQSYLLPELHLQATLDPDEYTALWLILALQFVSELNNLSTAHEILPSLGKLSTQKSLTKNEEVKIIMVKHYRIGLDEKYEVTKKWSLNDLQMIDGKEADTCACPCVLCHSEYIDYVPSSAFYENDSLSKYR
ncbi:hypothetical protein MG293_007042 [Ovis ammon polii]|uniref:Exocyst complex component Sec3 PIP2-binding N-terminal domain-containing protein n=1 Tax=Ovis ammon polii TaxID=230172 RepID=A0AAD4UBD3_OVIAM|nr:hypothetical protein MG293_007042 [Ovis ammon polii]KAI4572376.1 hypothetical protein MJT46_005444 [Ovis ammon polii x Ovis aries]